MKQLYDLSAQGKLTAKDFEEALDYLGDKYKNSTQEAMTSFTGMSMYIQSRWKVLWGKVTQQFFASNKKLFEDLSDILSDKMVAKYASLLSDALGTILKGVMGILDYVGNHKETIVSVIGNLGEILGIIGKTIWDVFAGILHTIAAAFGDTHDKSKDAHGALEDFNNILETILDHKGAIKGFTEAFLAIFAAKKIYDSVDALVAFYGILKSIVGLKGIGGVAQGVMNGATGGTLATDVEEAAANAPTRTAAGKILQKTGATTAGHYIGAAGAKTASGASWLFDKTFGVSRGADAVAEAAEGSVTRVGGDAAVQAAERGIIGRTAARIPVAGALIAGGTELIGINKRNRNEKIGRAVGAAGGTAGGGAAGAWIGGTLGTLIAPGAGTAVGAGIGSLVGSTAGGFLGAKSGGAIGKNIKSIAATASREARSMGQSLEKIFSDIGQRIAKIWSTITKPIVAVFNGLKKVLVAAAKGIQMAVLAPFVLLTAGIIKVWKTIEKPMGAVLKTIGKLFQNTWKSITKLTTRTWKGLTSIITKAFEAIKKPIQRSLQVIGKLIQTAWRTISRITSKVWNSVVKIVIKAVEAISRPISRVFNDIARVVSRAWNAVSRSTVRVWNEMERIIGRVLGSIWKFVTNRFDDIRDTIDDAMHAIQRIWGSVWDAMADKVKGIWATIKGVVSAGINAIASFWNTGANGLEKVAGFFGAKVNVPKMEKLANGTGGRQGESMLAMVNDQAGPLYREAIFRNTGHVEVPEGRNVITKLDPGDAVMPAAQTAKLLGIPRYEGGFGDWFGKALNYASSKIGDLADMVDDKLDAVEDALKDPLGTLVKIYTRGTNTAKVMWHDIADDGARNKIPHYAEKWFTNLLKKAEEKLDEIGGNGPVSASLIRRAAHKMKVDVSAGDIKHIMNVIQHESGGKINAINGWDTNAAAGHPSKGILQFIDSTFRAYAMPGHTNIWSPYDQLLAMFNDSTWRSDLTLGGWDPTGGRRFANGGWADMPGIFGEVPGEPELAVNPARDSSEEHIVEAIEARAKINPNGLAGGLSKLIDAAQKSQIDLVPTISDGNGHQRAITTAGGHNVDLSGDMNVTVQLDSGVIAHHTYPKLKALREHEMIIHGVGGAVPVGRGLPTGGGF